MKNRIAVVRKLLVTVLIMSGFARLDVAVAEEHTEDLIRVTLFNHVTEEFKVSPDYLWQTILDDFLEGAIFASGGYVVTPLTEDPAAYLGGFRMVLYGENDEVLDERVAYITEKNDEARRLRIYAHYLTDKKANMEVFAIYQAAPTETGVEYILDATSQMNIQEPDSSVGTVADVVSQITATADEFLIASFAAQKVEIEAEFAKK